MHRWAACPGSVALAEKCPKTTSAYAEEGTIAHDYCAKALEGNTVAIEDPEMREAVQLYVDYIRSLVGPLCYVSVEQRFDLSEIYPGLFGTADAVIYDQPRQTLHVCDFKYGAGIPVEVEENEQLMYYGLGALTVLLKQKKPIQTVVLHIIQPRCSHPKGAIRKWETDACRILDFAMDLVDLAHKTTLPDAPLNPGDHCRFCPAKPICPSLHGLAQGLAKQEFSQLSSPIPLDTKELGKLLHWLPVLESWIKGVREFAYSEAEHGRPIPGWKLVAKRATRKWTDVKEVESWLERTLTPTSLRECYERKLKSPAQIEEIVHKNKHGELAEFVTAVSSGNTLVEASDRRPEVKVLDAKSEFTQIESNLDLFN